MIVKLQSSRRFVSSSAAFTERSHTRSGAGLVSSAGRRSINTPDTGSGLLAQRGTIIAVGHGGGSSSAVILLQPPPTAPLTLGA